MRNEVYRWIGKIAFNTVAAVLAALIVFFCIGIFFPDTVKEQQNIQESAAPAASGEVLELKDVADFLSAETMASAQAKAAVPEETASLPAVSLGVADTPEANASAEQPALPALNLTAEDTPAENTEEDAPPSLLEILSRSIFSYKTLLSHEMPFIYGTEYISENIEQMMEEETAPEEIPEEIKLEIKKIEEEQGAELVVSGTGAQVLIYHTHTQEAYRQTADSKYVEAGKWRTKDASKSVVHLGGLLEKELEKYGFEVLHSKTNHEPPDLNSSYSRSLKTMKKYLETNKSLRVFIDLHRDASSDKDDVVIIDGKRCAKVMFVVGMGKSSSIKPDWKQSYKLANAITAKLEGIKKGFTRKVRVKEVRSYNQYMSDMCMLIEVGHNGNTLQEAENTIPYLAKAISEIIKVKEQ